MVEQTEISDQTMKQCVGVLKKIVEAKSLGKELWEDGAKYYAQVTMHRIPSFPQEQNIRKLVPLEHSLWTDQTTKCLLVKDLDKKAEETVDLIKEVLKENDVTGITKILPLDQLKKEHKGHELRRMLSKEFDVFLSDSRIQRLALSHLGKEFHNRRKIPICVDLEKGNLEKQIEKISKSTQVILTSRGANINIPFGHNLMSDENNFENLKSLVSQLGDTIPRGFKNIKVISLQGTGTKAIPLYRNDTVDPSVEDMSGLELERKAGFELLMQLREEIEPKRERKMKKQKQNGKKGKRKLMKAKITESGDDKKVDEAPTAKKAKVES